MLKSTKIKIYHKEKRFTISLNYNLQTKDKLQSSIGYKTKDATSMIHRNSLLPNH